ncbi:hypothetical protein AA0X95_20275 [Bacillus sp. 1P10SD]|uniref:hypothetical protein n=1 Tax=Bacillus sp. 1P10SD TaxID=3132265 RepID=UPI0039A476E2
MITTIDDVLGSLPQKPRRWKGSSTGTLTPPKLYEIYVYSLIARQFKIKKWQLNHYKNSKKLKGRGNFVFRGSPGFLWGGENFSYILLENGDKRYEMHLSIQINGKSLVDHEIDIAVFEHRAAYNAAKNGRVAQITGEETPLTIECKKYNIKLDKKLARECLGVAIETKRNAPERIAMFITNNNNKKVKQLLDRYDIKFFSEFDSSNRFVINAFNMCIKEFIDTL